MKKLFYTLGICIALNVGCTLEQRSSTVLFTDPQPEGFSDLSEIPARLQGDYLCGRDSSQLSVRPSGIFRRAHYPSKIHINEVDSSWILTGDSVLKERMGGMMFRVRRTGDSLNLNLITSDTLFLFDKNHHLRKFKGAYVLSSRKETGWGVTKLDKKNKVLTWSYIDENEADLLKKLSDSYIDSIPFQFQLSAAGFEEFLKIGAFTSADTFKLLPKSRKAFLRVRN